MRIGVHQLLPSLEEEDAIGNYARALQRYLHQRGFDSRIFVYRLKPGQKGICFHYRRHRRFSSHRNILIFHTALGSPLAEYFQKCPDIKILIHHNITPARFFAASDREAAYLAFLAQRQLRSLAGSVQAAIADSDFNAEELREMGFPEPAVIPLIFDWARLAGPTAPAPAEKYGDGKVNLLFVGRVAPHKKQEDLIRLFYLYRAGFNPESRLLLVGDHSGYPAYTKSLFNLVRDLNLKDVLFCGKVSLEELRAYYRLASIFICLSEHEGLGVPLLESFFYRLPVVAFAATAVPGTLGGAGVLVKEKRLPEVAGLLERLIRDAELRAVIIRGQNRRLEFFQNFPYQERWGQIIEHLL